MKSKRKLLTVLMSVGFLVLITTLYAFKLKTNEEESYQPQTKWKNLKVLPQNISKDSLDYLMDGYTSALSVKCNYCHAPQKDNPTKLDFASDDKIEKEIARGMIKMTKDLNKIYFQPHFPDPKPAQVQVVNCVMCHRGAPNPEKYLAKMSTMYKTYDPERDNRKEKILKEMGKQ
ncbi:c-type cytochrome [Flavobacterium sp. PL12]|uniref:c-type cytochrome n=1 Tax=Flavobacterium sp. PL12 TaxID=3071718 RepID=UPI00319E3C45